MYQTFRRLSISTLATVSVVAFAVSGCVSSDDQAQSYYESGMKLLAQHDYARAGLEFKNATRLNKALLPAWQRLAEVAEINQNWGDLVLILRTIVMLSPNDGAVKLNLGRLLASAGSLDEALTLANAVYEKNNRNADALALRAFIFSKREDGIAATTEARKALEIDPGNPAGLLVLANDRFAHGEPQAAIELLNSATEAHAKDAEIQLFKLMIFQKTSDLQGVESTLQELIKYYPEQTGFRKELARLYLFQHRNDDAEGVLRTIVATNPNDALAVLDLERFLYATRGPSEARPELVRRIEAGGEVFTYQMALAELDLSQEKYESAVELLGGLIKTKGSPEQILAAQIRLAEAYLRKNNNAAAEPLVLDILHKDSNDTDGLRLRASIRSQRGQLKGAVNDLREAFNKRPTPLISALLGVAYERDGSIELAERQFVEAMQASNYDPRISLYYVGYLRRRGSSQRAEGVLAELAGRWPNNTRILSTLLDTISMRKDPAGARGSGKIPTDQEMVEQLRDRSDYTGDLGVQYGREPGSVAAQPASKQPSALLVDLVNAYVQAQQLDKAMALLKSALRTNPADDQTYVLLGSLQLVTGAPDQAPLSYKSAIEAQPNNDRGYLALSGYYLRQNQLDEAAQVIREGLEKQPNSANLYVALGGLKEKIGDYEAAISEYQHALDKDPKSIVASNNLAYLLADRRADRASLEQASSLALSLRGSSGPKFKDTLGWVAYRQGDYRSAVPLLEEAVVAFPKKAVVHFHLGMAYLAVDSSESASEQFKLALDQNPDSELRERIAAALEKTSRPFSAETTPRVQADPSRLRNSTIRN